MSTQLTVIKGIQSQLEVEFQYKAESALSTLIPAKKMITDSDKMAFVYLIDDDEKYGHIVFPQQVWAEMLTSLKLGQDPFVVVKGEKVILEQFNEELTMLIYNIEGNHNYGEAFSRAVEKSFHEVLIE